MDTKILIDSIMRQTTVLIAQLSATAGIRAPLAHIADEVFLNLSEQLEAQGVSRKVVADMFGMALRGYQRRVQRLRESATDGGKTLWQVVLEFLQRERRTTRREVLERFRRDDPTAVGAVLNDLVSSGLAYRTGSGNEAVYGVTDDEDRRALARQGELETAAALVWLEICRDPRIDRVRLAELLSLDVDKVDRAIENLVEQGRIRRSHGELIAEPMVVPVGTVAGWEAALYDHFRTMCAAITSKLRQGKIRSDAADLTGGATLSFEIGEGHPYADRVTGLLAEVRERVNELWKQVEAYNAEHPTAEQRKRRVSFYFGQLYTPSEEDEA